MPEFANPRNLLSPESESQKWKLTSFPFWVVGRQYQIRLHLIDPKVNADGGTRTHTSKTLEPKSSASTNSATSANVLPYSIIA
ncbi:hypothetical protein MICAF_660037 [Microcystis aeruginosa PCC 9807]|uniref:Uncharacterized protein n=1 Tax=Microcystis aeruginosa PCC 9807 TaxID=1160283 RepID=I4HE04_MICAE|nr:hypothetical protein MICAF_660037 [Microcystis aeruginosa PCC 9807]